jgi:hypothetical protein
VLKYSLQLFLSMFNVSAFLTKSGYHDYTQVCDDNSSHLEKYLAIAGTALFWLSVFPIFHVVLNGLVRGRRRVMMMMMMRRRRRMTTTTMMVMMMMMMMMMTIIMTPMMMTTGSGYPHQDLAESFGARREE